jgi:lipoate-protein ligase A
MSGDTWRLLPYSAAPADQQLAAGDALVRALEPVPPAQEEQGGALPRPALRWYSMNPSGLILGSGQKLQEFDLAACQAAGVTLYRRSSGGTAVLSEPDQVMQDIALPRGHHLYTNDVTESYRWLGELWAAVLDALGVRAEIISIAEARADRHDLDELTRLSCYGGRSPYEVLVNGRKLIGLAQVRRRHGALLQTGIYTRWYPRRLADLLALTPAERDSLTGRLAARVAGLADVLPADRWPAGPGIDMAGTEQVDSLMALLMHTFAELLRDRHGVTLVEEPWSPAEHEARTRARARYAPLTPGDKG